MSETVDYNGLFTKPANPTYANHTFAGWYTDSSFTTEYDFSTAATSDITVYAKWIADTIEEPQEPSVPGDGNKPTDPQVPGDGNKPTDPQVPVDGNKPTGPEVPVDVNKAVDVNKPVDSGVVKPPTTGISTSSHSAYILGFGLLMLLGLSVSRRSKKINK